MSKETLTTRPFRWWQHTTTPDSYNTPQPVYIDAGLITAGAAPGATSDREDGTEARTRNVMRLTISDPTWQGTGRDRLSAPDVTDPEDTAADVWRLIGDPHVAWTPRGAHHIEVDVEKITQ